MSASVRLLLGSCMYNCFLSGNFVSLELLGNLLVAHKKVTQSKNSAALFDLKMKLGKLSVKRSVSSGL